MIKFQNQRQVLQLKNIPIEISNNIITIMQELDSSYGSSRNVEFDLGGYVLIAENIVDIEMLQQDKLEGLVPEYTDIFECSEGVNWTSSLFLLSSDFSIVVVTTEELFKFLTSEGEI